MKRKRNFTVIIERDQDHYYLAHVLELRGWYKQAKNLDTLLSIIPSGLFENLFNARVIQTERRNQ